MRDFRKTHKAEIRFARSQSDKLFPWRKKPTLFACFDLSSSSSSLLVWGIDQKYIYTGTGEDTLNEKQNL